MKILIFSPYYPPHTGGLESHAEEFNRHMSPHVRKIYVFTPRIPATSPEKEIKYGNVEILRFPAFEIILNYPVPKFWLPSFWKMFFSLYKKDFGFVISRTRFFLTSLMALFYAKTRKKRWIHIEHGSDFVRLSSKSKTLIAKLYDFSFGFLVFRLSNLNISISKAVQDFVYKFDKRESPIVYRGIDMDAIDRIEPANELVKKYKDKIIISFAGRLFKWKGVENSILAIKSLPEEIKQKIIFFVVGDGEDSTRLKAMVGKSDPIVFLGNQPREKAIGVLKISSIYIHSSLPGGGLSTSLLEAMYCGCTVIATPNEGADEVIANKKNGLLIPCSEKNTIAEKIKEILLEKANTSYCTEARKSIANHFNWQNTITNYQKILSIRTT